MANITHIIESSATGTLSMAALLANAQVCSGHSVSVIFSRRKETPEHLDEVFNPAIKLINIQMNSATQKLLSIFFMRKCLGVEKPDVVFMHSSFAGFIGRISSIGLLPASKFFYIPHCISMMRQDIGPVKRGLFSALEWIASIKKCEYIACSSSEKSVIERLVPFRTVHLVENAVPTLLECGAKPNRRNRIVTVGQIRPQKGPLDFAVIARQTLHKIPDAEFVWIGDGDIAFRTRLEAAGVKITGWVDRARVMEELGSADLYLSTALWEGMPVSIIEAMYSRLPVIASNCAGNVDVIEQGQTGWLFNSHEAACAIIVKLLRDPSEARRVAAVAHERATTRFASQRYLNEIEKLLALEASPASVMN